MTIPTIAQIERTNSILAIAATIGLFFVASRATAIACALGSAVVIANLILLAAIGKVLLGLAVGGTASAKALGAVALPLKLLMVTGLIYLVFARAHIDGIGFGIGVLTQFAAILIETGRASIRSRSARIEVAESQN